MSQTNIHGQAVRERRFHRPLGGSVWYFVALALILVGTFVAHMRLNGIFACPASEYGGNHYLGHCEATAYGDYDHGAIWFNLEPEARERAHGADVLFLGNSRMQFGFSAPALGRWFASYDRNYFLLGFSHSENLTFIGPAAERVAPTARAYVINADDFFASWRSGPGRDVMFGASVENRYRAKRAWQAAHRALCTRAPSLCGEAMAFYRQRDTGEWLVAGDVGPASGIERELPIDQAELDRALPIARSYLASLSVAPECIIFTYVPHREHKRAEAAALAQALGVRFVSPVIDGLTTFDTSHLDRSSAERFTRAFFEGAGPQLAACLDIEAPFPPVPAP